MKQLLRTLFLVLAMLFASRSARALTFNVTYDASVSNSGNLANIQTGISVVTNTFHVLFTNASTVNLVIYWGATDLSENTAVLGGPFTYAELTNALRNMRSSGSDSNAVASLPASDPIATNKWWLPRAQAKAFNLGTNNLNQHFFTNRNDTNNDGSVTFSSTAALVKWNFNPTNRTVAGEYDFIGAAEHEISEMMGRTYELNQGGNGLYVPYDLFRFTNSGTRCFDPYATTVYFSVDKGTNNLKMFSPNFADGDDPQDWADSTPSDAFDAEVPAGVILPLSPVDLTVMDILGYNSPSFPQPRVAFARTNGVFSLSFTNATGLPFSVFATTNLAISFTNWTYLGAPVESPTGHYQFVDLLTNTARFYRVRMP